MKKKKYWESPEVYIRSPNHCPACGSTMISADSSADIDDKFATQRVSCSDCEANWDDIYKLVHYEKVDD